MQPSTATATLVLSSIFFFVMLLTAAMIVPAYRYASHRTHPGGKSMISAFRGVGPVSLPINALNYYASREIREQTPYLRVEEQLPRHRMLTDAWRMIRAEALAVSDNFVSYEQIDSIEHRDTFVLRYNGEDHKANMALCPVTAAVVRAMPELRMAMFSRLAVGKRLATHRGPWSGIARIHLPLLVPSHHKAFISVGDERHYWREGQLVALDDTFTHWVHNPAPGDGVQGVTAENACARFILFADVDRQGMSQAWRRKVERFMGPYFRHINRKVEHAPAVYVAAAGSQKQKPTQTQVPQ